MRRSRSYPRDYNKAPRQLIDEAQLRRTVNGHLHGSPIGRQLTGGAISRTAADSALASDVNGAE
jgi:hypothetical protein